MMVTTKKHGGIGAMGSAAAVREKYPPETRARAINVVITGEAQRRVRHTTHLCYFVSIPNVKGECYIVKKNFCVEVSPETPFDSENIPIAQVVCPDPEVVDRAALEDVVPHVRRGPGISEQIAELRAEGIEVDDDNEPLDEGDTPVPPPSPVRPMHNLYSTPTHCPHRALNLTDNRGKWAHH